MITKREAKLIGTLPDGYDYMFLNNGAYVVGASPGREVIAFKILEDDTLQQIEITFDPNAVHVSMNKY